MALWEGPAQAGRIHVNSIRTWADDRSNNWVGLNGDPVVWWESGHESTLGVQFPPGPCIGAHCAPYDACVSCDQLDCDGCEPIDGCYVDVPDWASFKPFWVKLGFKHCSPIARDPNQLYRWLARTVDETGWVQIGKRYHQLLQDEATDLSGASASTVTEGIGTLLRNRGTAGLGWGALVVPGYLLPMVVSKGLVEERNGQSFMTGTGIRIFSDPGFPISGPGGASVAPGGGYIYAVDGPPTVAFRDVLYPGGENWDWNNNAHQAMFYNAGCGCGSGCFEPLIKRQAIVAFNNCAAFAIAVDGRDCDCPDSLPVVKGETPEGGAEGG